MKKKKEDNENEQVNKGEENKNEWIEQVRKI